MNAKVKSLAERAYAGDRELYAAMNREEVTTEILEFADAFNAGADNPLEMSRLEDIVRAVLYASKISA